MTPDQCMADALRRRFPDALIRLSHGEDGVDVYVESASFAAMHMADRQFAVCAAFEGLPPEVVARVGSIVCKPR